MAASNHFKIWQIASKPLARGVTLRGQFDKINQDAATVAADWLANPVDKNGEGIADITHHLVGYSLKPPPPPPAPKRWVMIANQFYPEQDKTVWQLGDPKMLLLPASKTIPPKPPQPPPVPTDLAHFLCYAVEQPKAFAKNVTLEDQFDIKLNKPEKITGLQPAYFAVPVSKNGGPIVNVDIHLALYNIAPRSPAKPPIQVLTRDQFGVLELTAQESIILAVPTAKLAWGEGAGP